MGTRGPKRVRLKRRMENSKKDMVKWRNVGKYWKCRLDQEGRTLFSEHMDI